MAVEIRTVSSSGGVKGTKLQAYDKIPAVPLNELAILYGLGVSKYPSRNWERGYEYSKSFSSLMRHLQLFMSGESYDLELNSNHLANVAWHCITLYTFSEQRPEFDDRVFSQRNIKPKQRPVFIDSIYPVEHNDIEKNVRDNQLEPRYDLIPLAPLARLAELYGSGGVAVPVEDRPELFSAYYSRLLEHAWKFWGGTDTDPDGHHHMIWALHYTLSMFDTFKRFPNYDDRFTEQLGAQPIGFNSIPENSEEKRGADHEAQASPVPEMEKPFDSGSILLYVEEAEDNDPQGFLGDDERSKLIALQETFPVSENSPELADIINPPDVDEEDKQDFPSSKASKEDILKFWGFSPRDVT